MYKSSARAGFHHGDGAMSSRDVGLCSAQWRQKEISMSSPEAGKSSAVQGRSEQQSDQQEEYRNS